MRKLSLFKHIITLIFLLVSPLALAESSIGEVAQNLMGPTSLVTKLVIIACYVIGFIFVFMALAQYKIHRQSPKLVPLGTPLILLFLGIVALLLPYVTNMGGTGKADDVPQEKGTPLPFEPDQRKVPGIPLPPIQKKAPPPPAEPVEPSPPPQYVEPVAPAPEPSTPPPDDSGGGGGHWTDDPRYN